MTILKQGMKAFLRNLGAYSTGKLVPAVLLLLIGLVVIRIIIRIVSAALVRTKLEKAAYTLIKSAIRVVMYLLLSLMVASLLGIDVSGVVALASVLTLALSLALQNVLGNVISGFVLLTSDPFNSGDYVEIAGQAGTVVEIGLTYTKLNTGDNKLVSIPNSAVTAAQIVNYSANNTRRVSVSVAASYDCPVEDVLKALLLAAELPTALKDPEPFAAVEVYEDSAIRYTLRIWCKNEDYWTTQFEANKRVKAVFDEKGIAMTYPHLNVHLDK